MHLFEKKTLLASAMLLGLGVGQAIANDSATAQPQPSLEATHSAMAPAWLRMAPVPGAYYYWVPQTGMAWPVPVMPQYAVPMPPPATGAWAPFVWLLVPSPAMATVPATVDYGPVADTPVVELPLSDETPAAAIPEKATQAPATMDADRTARVPGPGEAVHAPVSVEAMTRASVADTAIQAAAAPESTPLPAAPVARSAVAVNYGPVAPTPVVRLPVPGKRAAATRSRNTSRVKSRAAGKAAAAAPKPLPVSVAAPTRKRLCWSNGVVAPCR